MRRRGTPGTEHLFCVYPSAHLGGNTLIIPKHYEDLSVLHEGTMPDRAYYVPAGRRMKCLVENREASDRIHMLNGSY